MRFLARRSALIAIASALVVVPAVAGAQAPPPGGPASPAPPPPGGPASPAPAGGTAAPAGTGDSRSPSQKNLDAPGDAKGEKRDAAGFTFTDKPAAGVRRGPFRTVKAGPLATFPGFEQLPDGGSRVFVQISQNVPVEERRAQGSITYVLKGAHVRVHNDTNTLVTVHFNTPVATAKLIPSGNDALLVVNLRASSSPTFKVTDNTDKSSTLTIDFAKGDFGNADTVTQTPDTPSQPTARKVGRSKRGGAPPAPPPAPNGAPPPAPPPAGPKP